MKVWSNPKVQELSTSMTLETPIYKVSGGSDNVILDDQPAAMHYAGGDSDN